MARSMARQAAMQLLYERLSGGEADDESLDLVYEQLTLAQQEGMPKLRPSKEERVYIADVLDGVQQNENELDKRIDEHSTGSWALSRVSHVDLCILRLAAYEMFFRADVPDSVAISEAMDMADRYSEPKSGRYINGVLGALEREKQKG